MRFVIFLLIVDPLAFAKPLPEFSNSPELFAWSQNAQVGTDEAQPVELSSANQDNHLFESGDSDTVTAKEDSLDGFSGIEIDPATQEPQTLSQPLDSVDSDFLIAQVGSHVTKEECGSEAGSKGLKPLEYIADGSLCRMEPRCEDALRQRYCCNSKSNRLDSTQQGCTPCS